MGGVRSDSGREGNGLDEEKKNKNGDGGFRVKERRILNESSAVRLIRHQSHPRMMRYSR